MAANIVQETGDKAKIIPFVFYQKAPKNLQTCNRPESSFMRNLCELKAESPDAIHFFKIGNFYEAYLYDAVNVSRILGVALTKGSIPGSDGLPCCGFPLSVKSAYVSRLVEAGETVMVCEVVG